MNRETNPFNLEGKSVLVTGASSGIGRQVCIVASKLGARIIAIGRDEKRLQNTLMEMDGEGHKTISLDLTQAEKIQNEIGQIERVDGVVNAAGAINIKPYKYIASKDIEDIDNINYKAPLLFIQQLVKRSVINDGGSIVFIASIAGIVGAKAHSIYAGTKGAIISASRCLAMELAVKRIRVNCVSPGMVRTPMFEKTKELLSEAAVSEYERMYPLGFGEPQDVANAAAFLLSDASRWITGSNLVIDGGFTCH